VRDKTQLELLFNTCYTVQFPKIFLYQSTYSAIHRTTTNKLLLTSKLTKKSKTSFDTDLFEYYP